MDCFDKAKLLLSEASSATIEQYTEIAECAVSRARKLGLETEPFLGRFHSIKNVSAYVDAITAIRALHDLKKVPAESEYAMEAVRGFTFEAIEYTLKTAVHCDEENETVDLFSSSQYETENALRIEIRRIVDFKKEKASVRAEAL